MRHVGHRASDMESPDSRTHAMRTYIFRLVIAHTHHIHSARAWNITREILQLSEPDYAARAFDTIDNTVALLDFVFFLQFFSAQIPFTCLFRKFIEFICFTAFYTSSHLTLLLASRTIFSRRRFRRQRRSGRAAWTCLASINFRHSIDKKKIEQEKCKTYDSEIEFGLQPAN